VEDLPGYHYRDDALAWWDILKQYCAEFIALHYTSDELVQGDSELQNMVDEVGYDHTEFYLSSYLKYY
jgi:hypothetical protein